MTNDQKNIEYLLTPLFYSVSIIIVYALLILPSTTFNPLTTVFAQPTNNQPNINATSVFDTGQIILPGNVKHLVIVILNKDTMDRVKIMKRGLLLSHLSHKM
jgi:hypothetical protein